MTREIVFFLHYAWLQLGHDFIFRLKIELDMKEVPYLKYDSTYFFNFIFRI